jgi:hypothetical protein
MADIGSHHFVKGMHKEVLVPQPTDNPNDPLNWNTKWKAACITAAALATFTQGLGPLALAPMFPALMKAFDCDLEEAVQFTGVCILVLGFSNFIWYVGYGYAIDRTSTRFNTELGRREIALTDE